MKPSLAEDAILSKLVFPCGVQPKIDGVRGMHITGQFTGRSLDPFEGFGITDYFSNMRFKNLDGEMTLGDNPHAEKLCSDTTGAMGRFKGVTEMADLHWWVFDLVSDDLIGLPYEQRYGFLERHVKLLNHPRVHLVPMVTAYTLEEVQEAHERFVEQGYEGTIIRSLTAPYKEGRATQKGQELWRIKPWGDFEILVTGITEGQANGNEAKKNTLGRTERSSAKAGMVPNGEVGSIQGTLVKDVVVNGGKLVLPKGLLITAGPGKLTQKQAKHYFDNPNEIVGHFAKIKHMTHGVKDLPRFPTFESLRLKQDMS